MRSACRIARTNPILFELLNAMDGLAEDQDVLFVLTTNRADLLEPALASRPGRVDQAVELPLPDADGRRRLVELYGEGLGLTLRDDAPLIEELDGTSPAFIRELLRRAALVAADETADGPLRVGERHLHAALDELRRGGERVDADAARRARPPARRRARGPRGVASRGGGGPSYSRQTRSGRTTPTSCAAGRAPVSIRPRCSATGTTCLDHARARRPAPATPASRGRGRRAATSASAATSSPPAAARCRCTCTPTRRRSSSCWPARASAGRTTRCTRCAPATSSSTAPTRRRTRSSPATTSSTSSRSAAARRPA